MTLKDWHKSKVRWFQQKADLSDYQMLWLSFLKGLLIGVILL